MTQEMTFLEHLGELRGCLLRVMIGVAVGAVACFVGANTLFEFLAEPFFRGFPEAQLVGTGPAEAFMVKLKIALAGGVLLSSPWAFYQLWIFISPALHEHEHRYALPFVFTTTLFFLTGAGFCFYVVFPFALDFFYQEYVSLGLDRVIKISEYFSFVLRLVIIFGVVFELPVLSFILAKMRILTHTWLIEQARYGVLAIFIVAAILTPPDPVSQLLLAGPLIVIYGLCIGVTYAVAQSQTKEVAKKE